jgi:TetR/AcrR family transcriptional regulator, tetracycline repressor protein
MALDRNQIIVAAIGLLDEGGLDRLTLRRLAQRLGVQAPTLYWHIRNKAELVNTLAEAILNEQLTQLTPADGQGWQAWLIDLAQQLRRTMLAHPDGARLVSAAQLSPTLAAVSELAMRTLVQQGLPLRQARLTVLVVERFTIGHVLEEQSPPPDPAMLQAFDRDAFAQRHPTIAAGISEYFQPGITVDDLFRDSLELILGCPDLTRSAPPGGQRLPAS